MKYPPKPRASAAYVNRAISAAASVFGVNDSDVFSGRRPVSITKPRLAVYLSLEAFDDKSVAAIVGRHRTAIVSGRRSAKNWVFSCKNFAESVNAVIHKYEK